MAENKQLKVVIFYNQAKLNGFGFEPNRSGHDHELEDSVVESRIRVLMPLKTCRVEGLMHVKLSWPNIFTLA
ncbi:hypothetical protein TNCV_2295151 [Trichonephila clavipes]|nr:hypothetical protein TNCV_2295151 [Trichonephila clavipes]